ncbi:MAG: DUF6569 family protein [Candidatus Bathyarchaeia archaeon]
MIKKFIESVREEKEGFSFDRPWRLEEKSLGVIIPILRKSRAKRNYITLIEAQAIKTEDTGQIDYVFVKNDEKDSVLVSRGEIFRGKTQERAAIHDHIIEPGKGLRVAVRCIHASKGIQAGTEMKYGGRTPYDVAFETQGRTWEMSNTISVNYARESSNTTWGSSTSRDTLRSSDDLVSTLDEISDAMKVAMKKIPAIKNQVGAAFFYENRMRGMDIYDLPLSWDAVKKDVVEKEGADFLKKDEAEMFKFKPEKGRALVKKFLSAPFEEKEIYNRDYKLIELRSDKLIGEAIEYKNKVIHLTFWEKK